MSRQDNLETFFRDGKTVILPIDHGVAIPVPGLEDPFHLIEELNPYVDGYVLNLGLALRDKKDLDGAVVQFKKAIEINPKYIAAHHNLGLAGYAPSLWSFWKRDLPAPLLVILVQNGATSSSKTEPP